MIVEDFSTEGQGLAKAARRGLQWATFDRS
jgi:hypothetical protein